LLNVSSVDSVTRTFGSPRIIGNAVFHELRDLSARFGESFSFGRNFFLHVHDSTPRQQDSERKGDKNEPGVGAYDESGGKRTIKAIYDDYAILSDGDYPAIDEIR